MGALYMFGFIVAIAIGGTAYFFHQEKKAAQQHAQK